MTSAKEIYYEVFAKLFYHILMMQGFIVCTKVVQSVL